MAATNITAAILKPGEVELTPWPLKHVLEGKPEASYCVIGHSEDGRSYSGVWECTPGKFRVNYEWEETIYVLDGNVTIEEENGDVREFKSGDIVHFPKGLRCIWTVHKTIRKTYTLFDVEPPTI